MNLLRRKSNAADLPAAFRARLESILGVAIDEHGEFDLGWTWQSAAEARQYLDRIPPMQDALRAVKKDVDASMKKVRSEFAERRGKVDRHPISAVAERVGAKAFAAQNKASRREKLSQQKEAALGPLQTTRRIIDNQIIRLDGLKAQIEAWLRRQE